MIGAQYVNIVNSTIMMSVSISITKNPTYNTTWGDVYRKIKLEGMLYLHIIAMNYKFN
jgi:hypothetical protein